MTTKRTYHLGKSRILRDMQVGDVIYVPYEDAADYASLRSIGSKLRRIFHAAYTFRREGDNIEITRTA